MGVKKLLIAGIDPGTTLGYAVIDLEGNLVQINSSKNLDINSLISELIDFGKIVVIGTDKKKNPSFIERLGVKLGAKVIAPEYDLKVVEKRGLVKEYKTNNQHEIDALASAFFISSTNFSIASLNSRPMPAGNFNAFGALSSLKLYT